MSEYRFDGKELYEGDKVLSKAMAGIRLNEKQKKIDELEKKLAEAIEYNKTFLGYALADRYQWDNDFLIEVGRHIKSLKAVKP